MESKSFTPVSRYKQSKLCNILFSNYLSEHLSVSVYSVSPGIVRTNLGRHILQSFSWIKKLVVFALYPFFVLLTSSAQQGAQTVLFCVLNEELEVGFYRNCEKTQLLEHARNKENETKLWLLSEKLVEEWLN